MRLVRELSNPYSKLHYFYCYEYERGTWQIKDVFHAKKQEDLYGILIQKKGEIDYAILGLNGTFRNTFYVCSPKIIIMISPITLWGFCEELWPTLEEETYLEVAIGLEAEGEEIDFHEQICTFLYCLYQKKNKDEALDYYEKWQLENTITDKKLQHFVRTIEYFKEEIFNYFLLHELIY